ncbi:putative Major facilitator superfamily MFS_1 [Candidatus Desulfosporosinus infrequens]|uniref:Putative Major facilitator superfamily MFS_1 n=1 Tax=Candidatus Desulfosporosinus infrequens TaxID=2043169 RepID=A0A2U3LSA4_9FIRM|nr:putative Major facilitator superfamily MFS_1 [Candidatus Desulfosporosinus infrequens]
MASKEREDNPLTLLKEKDFTLLLTGQFVSALGDKLHYIALGVLIYRITGSAFEVGKMTLATFLPYLLFGLIAGAYVDRWDKKRTMVTADLLRAALVGLIPILIGYSINLVYLLTFLGTTANLFFSPAKMAVIPAIFTKEKILTATSLAETAENLTDILGYALAGVLIMFIPIQKVFYLDSLTFLFSAAAIYSMSFKFEVQHLINQKLNNKNESHILPDILEGLAYIRKTKVLAVTLLTYCLALLIFSGFNPLIFVYALDTLKTTTVGLGILEASAAVGITVGSAVISVWGTRMIKQNLMLWGYFISGLTILTLGIFPDYTLALIGFFITGVSNAMFLLPVQSIFQEETAAPMRGRVFSARFALTRVAFMGSVGILSYGATQIGVGKVYLLSGLTLLIGTIILAGFAFLKEKE